MVMKGRFDTDVAEVLAALHALSIVIEAGLHKLVIESDCLKLTNHFKKGSRESSYFRNIVNNILVTVKGLLLFCF